MQLHDFVIDVDNVHQAMPKGIQLLRNFGVREESRNGPVLVSPFPVQTLYRVPQERVIFWPHRDANPFMHVMEALWMLAGREDVAFPAYYAKQLREYSDDGETLAGAYGYRWRHYFSQDQLDWVVAQLGANPNDRRVVLSMWDPYRDPYRAQEGGKDVPCNTQIFFRIRSGNTNLKVLDMQVNCRSNDILWGAYGANAVHFSMLQEYIAGRIGVLVGWYIQNSFNYHLYLNFFEKMEQRYQNAKESYDIDPYYTFQFVPHPIISTQNDFWVKDLHAFLAGAEVKDLFDPFFRAVAVPMRDAYKAYKEKQYDAALQQIRRCAARDWRKAGEEWLERRAVERAARASQSA